MSNKQKPPTQQVSARPQRAPPVKQVVPHIGQLAKRPKPEAKPTGEPPPGRYGVYDAKGNMRGHVGPNGTEMTARRLGVPNAKLKTKSGVPGWYGQTLAEVSAKGATTAEVGGTNGQD
jgi:hypothetical protein